MRVKIIDFVPQLGPLGGTVGPTQGFQIGEVIWPGFYSLLSFQEALELSVID